MRTFNRLITASLFTLLFSSPLFAEAKIAAVSERMKEFIAKKEIAGAVTIVVSPDKILHLDAAGKADLAADVPMREDHIFWIASMTKPMTGVCVMMLQDEGKLSVEDPV